MPASLAERSVLGREASAEIQVRRAQGDFLFDERGKRYIDFTMGWCVGNLGWRHPAVDKAVANFDGPDYVYPDFGYKSWLELAGLLSSIAPPKLRRCFRATGGSEAVDLALQAAMIHTGRRRFLALAGGYHGNTVATLSLVASENRETLHNRLTGCDEISPPLDGKALAKVERRLARRQHAAVVMEPISINLGVLVPDTDFMLGLQRACRRHGTLLIMDEVATGFGRTGTIFATEQFGVQPDLMCLGKAITNGAAGLGTVLMTSAVAASMEKDGNFYSTYGWHPRAVHAAIATVRYFVQHGPGLMQNAAAIGGYCRDRLERLPLLEGATVRCRGLAIAVDVASDRYADAIKARCRRRGLLIATEGKTLLLLPSLEVSRATARRAMDVLEACAAENGRNKA